MLFTLSHLPGINWLVDLNKRISTIVFVLHRVFFAPKGQWHFAVDSWQLRFCPFCCEELPGFLLFAQCTMLCLSVQFVLLNLSGSGTCAWAGASPQMTLSEFEFCLNYIYVFSLPCFFGILYHPSVIWHQWILSKFTTSHAKKLSRCSFCRVVLPGSVYLMVLIKNHTRTSYFPILPLWPGLK